MGGRGFESRQKRPKLKDENICILGDASFSHKKSIPDQKGARSSASISRVCPGRVGADPGTHPLLGALVVVAAAATVDVCGADNAAPANAMDFWPNRSFFTPCFTACEQSAMNCVRIFAKFSFSF